VNQVADQSKLGSPQGLLGLEVNLKLISLLLASGTSILLGSGILLGLSVHQSMDTYRLM
jgi:hypothetical protein